jgi:hypothetical protein
MNSEASMAPQPPVTFNAGVRFAAIAGRAWAISQHLRGTRLLCGARPAHAGRLPGRAAICQSRSGPIRGIAIRGSADRHGNDTVVFLAAFLQEVAPPRVRGQRPPPLGREPTGSCEREYGGEGPECGSAVARPVRRPHRHPYTALSGNHARGIAGK